MTRLQGGDWFCGRLVLLGSRQEIFKVSGVNRNTEGEVVNALLEDAGGRRVVYEGPPGDDVGTASEGDAAFFYARRMIHRQHRSSEQRARHRMFAALDVWSCVLPSRVACEDLDDYRERIRGLLESRRRREAWFVMGAAILWTGLNALRYAISLLKVKRTKTRR
jgi:hypothetical protein